LDKLKANNIERKKEEYRIKEMQIRAEELKVEKVHIHKMQSTQKFIEAVVSRLALVTIDAKSKSQSPTENDNKPKLIVP
jgi:hypothetical protein